MTRKLMTDAKLAEMRKCLADDVAYGGAIECEYTGDDVRRLLDHIDALQSDIDDRQRSFDLRWKADMRAIKAWQAETGKELTWPDHADLCVWLLGKLDAVMDAAHYSDFDDDVDPVVGLRNHILEALGSDISDPIRNAAPDLLAALEGCLHVMNFAYSSAENFAVLEKLRARAAIAKAKGE